MEQKHFGFWGRILRVNLTTKKITVEEPDPRLYRVYMGGRSMALKFLLDELTPDVRSLDADNKLIFMTSPTTGTPISGQSRATGASLSPLTGGLADSQCGGWWPAELKFAGWDGIILEGRSPEPVYININDENVEILTAKELWGIDTGDAQDILTNHHPKAKILQIGPAGENLVRYANITCDLRHFFGRGGLGAVMGSKNLRAIVVRGSNRKIKVADPDTLKKISTWFAKGTKKHPAISVHHELGTAKGVVPLSVEGMLPTFNFQDGSFEAAERVSGETMQDELGAGTETCFACAVKCKRVLEGENDKFKVTRNYGGPEYESLGSLGPQIGVDDIFAIGQANERCNALGLDTISAGVTIAWAIECFERGLLNEKDTEGINFKWNDPETYLKLLEMIARRNGFGDLLAEGSLRAGLAVGKGAEEYAMHVKGQELPSHEPRGKWGVGLGYAVSPTGADHLQAAHDPFFTKPGDYSKELNWVDLEDLSPLGIFDPIPSEDLSASKVRLFVYLQYMWGLHDVIDWCIFTTVPEYRAISLKQLVDVVQAVTGWRTSLFEMAKAGERGITMARAFNCMFGFTEKDDTLPNRFFEPMRDGTLKGHYIDREQFEDALELYYGMMGWDNKGIPTRAKLEELGVGWIWERLKSEKIRGGN